MKLAPLTQESIPQVMHLMGLGAPYIRVRTYSDYWLYARLFSSSCPLAFVDGDLVGAVIAFRSQDDPTDVYVQDAATHPDHRGRGVASALLAELRAAAIGWGCTRLYATTEPENTAARAACTSLGFVNVPGDRVISGVSVTTAFKGPGRDRAVYQLDLPQDELRSSGTVGVEEGQQGTGIDDHRTPKPGR